jgi:hypothetical protein
MITDKGIGHAGRKAVNPDRLPHIFFQGVEEGTRQYGEANKAKI